MAAGNTHVVALTAGGDKGAGPYTRPLSSPTSAVLVTPLRVPLSDRLGGKSCTQRIPQNVLTLSRKVDDCKPLQGGAGGGGDDGGRGDAGPAGPGRAAHLPPPRPGGAAHAGKGEDAPRRREPHQGMGGIVL